MVFGGGIDVRSCTLNAGIGARFGYVCVYMDEWIRKAWLV